MPKQTKTMRLPEEMLEDSLAEALDAGWEVVQITPIEFAKTATDDGGIVHAATRFLVVTTRDE